MNSPCHSPLLCSSRARRLKATRRKHQDHGACAGQRQVRIVLPGEIAAHRSDEGGDISGRGPAGLTDAAILWRPASELNSSVCRGEGAARPSGWVHVEGRTTARQQRPAVVPAGSCARPWLGINLQILKPGLLARRLLAAPTQLPHTLELLLLLSTWALINAGGELREH